MGSVGSRARDASGDRYHIRFNGTVAALRGWGHATPPNWSVRVELRDPGVLVVTRGPTRRPREVVTIPITRLQLKFGTVHRSKGGDYVGGGFGIGGAVLGIATAKALNHMTYAKWEETQLHVIELAAGTTRTIVITLPGITPITLAEELNAALRAWSHAWAQAVINGDPRHLINPADVSMTWDQIRTIRERGLIHPDNALTLGQHVAAPFLFELRQRVLHNEIDRDDADELLDILHDAYNQQLLTMRELGPIRRLLQAIPSPEIAADQAAERQRLLDHLQALRRTGAITEDELARERSRLLGD